MEVTRNGDEEECNRGSGKGGEGGEDEMRRETGKGKVGWGRKERKEDECRQSKKCRRKSACARRPAKKMQCERKEGRESGVSRNAARVWRTKAKREGNRVRNGEMEKQ